MDEEGEVGYYSPDGESMRKAFLRNPLDVFRISSNFNPRRRHPILNTIRAHKGTDYAAPTGTPIRATSEGRITRASRYGSFGKSFKEGESSPIFLQWLDCVEQIRSTFGNSKLRST